MEVARLNALLPPGFGATGVTVFTQQTQPPREAPQTRFAGDFSSIAFALTLMFVVRERGAGGQNPALRTVSEIPIGECL